jgi:hypothetical protein
MTALLLQLICGWLWAGPLDGLQAGYEARTDQYHGHAVERIDYSRALAAHTRMFKGSALVPLKKIFANWKDETFVNISETGHVAILSRGMRYDGRLAYLRPITLEPSKPWVEAGLIIRIKADPADRDRALEALRLAMEAMKGKRSATCVGGGCSAAQGAGTDIPSFLLPADLLRYTLEHELHWQGKPLRLQYLSTVRRSLPGFLGYLSGAALHVMRDKAGEAAQACASPFARMFH